MLLGHAGALLTLGAMTGVDADSCEVHTDGAGVLSYDALLVACGATPQAAVAGALTFRGPADMERMTGVLEEARSGTRPENRVFDSRRCRLEPSRVRARPDDRRLAARRVADATLRSC